MRKIFLLILSLGIVGSVLAQDGIKGGEIKNAGNDAIRAKKYGDAIVKYEEYLKLNDFKDAAVVFNTAYCATKMKKYDLAVKYFDMSIKNTYKLSSSYLGKAKALENLKKYNDMVKTLETGMKALNNPKKSRKLETMYASYILKQGQNAQKSGNISAADSYFKKVANLSRKSLKFQANYSLGVLYYNKGAKLLQDLYAIATTDKPKYEAGKKKAKVDFNKALTYLGKAKILDAKDENTKTLIKEIKGEISKL